ncbi:MAG: sulfotransferase [Myxococcota bacterium]
MMGTPTKIFGIGLSRTGTTSLTHALGALGVRATHDCLPLFREPLHPMVAAHEAFVDTPVPLRFPLYDRCFPGSRFVLTTRARDAWLKSMRWLFEHGKAWWRWPLEVHQYHQALYGSAAFDEGRLVATFDAYHAAVDEYFAERPDDLLRLDVSRPDALALLAAFLDRPPPEDPAIPRSNASTPAPLRHRARYALAEHLLIRPALRFAANADAPRWFAPEEIA